MNRKSKLIATTLFLMCAHSVYAQNQMSSDNSNISAAPPKECAKPCPPKPCKPCPAVCFERGYPDTNCCIQSAYNEPANFLLSPCPWDFWVDASFTYWTAYEEGLVLAISDSNVSSLPTSTPLQRVALFQDTKWEPGFKIGLGLDLGHDDWSAFAEYTWFRSRTTTSETAPSGLPPGSTTPSWVPTNYGIENEIARITVRALSSVWRLNMDVLDVGLTRPYYQGTHLIVAPLAGVRAAWIRQNLRIHPTPFITSAFGVNTNAVFHNKSQSWAVGPRGGLQGKWHLGYGFRIEGDMTASILFTQYTTVASSADAVNDGNRPYALSYTNYNTFRFNNDMNVGLGWGDYFSCRNYHFDLLASYDFQIFWNQNMMRKLVDQFQTYSDAPAQNLYLQGLTLRAQLDF